MTMSVKNRDCKQDIVPFEVVTGKNNRTTSNLDVTLSAIQAELTLKTASLGSIGSDVDNLKIPVVSNSVRLGDFICTCR